MTKQTLSLIIASLFTGLISISHAAPEPLSDKDKASIEKATTNMQTAASSTLDDSIKVINPSMPASTQSGVSRMKDLMETIRSGDYSGVSPEVRIAIESAKKSAEYAADTDNMDDATVKFSIDQTGNWQKMALEAYVAALPPRDRAIGASVMLGDGTVEGSSGKMYIFVSRSMPMAMLRAYALDALYTGSSLVVKGLRKGDTVKDYIEEVIEEFNSADGQILAGIEINPNLFDMFGIDVVPAVVWTNRGGLDDIGSGCQQPPDVIKKMMTVEGPEGAQIDVEKPYCMPAPDTSYYKLAGALKMEYVLDRFAEAGVPLEAVSKFRSRLATRVNNVHQGDIQPSIGNAITPVSTSLKMDRLPRHLLESWKEDLHDSNVQRGPFGPVFGLDQEDDPAYRQELQNKVDHQLGLSPN